LQERRVDRPSGSEQPEVNDRRKVHAFRPSQPGLETKSRHKVEATMSIFTRNRNAVQPIAVPVRSPVPIVVQPVPRRRFSIMGTFIFLAVLIAGVFLILGYLRDWYTVSADRSAEDGDFSVGMNVHVSKLKADAGSAKDYIGSLFEKGKGQTSEKQD
jgi:hypothetical protein